MKGIKYDKNLNLDFDGDKLEPKKISETDNPEEIAKYWFNECNILLDKNFKLLDENSRLKSKIQELTNAT